MGSGCREGPITVPLNFCRVAGLRAAWHGEGSPDELTYLGELAWSWSPEQNRTGGEADRAAPAEDVLRNRPVQGQHRQLVTYFH